MKSPHSKLLVKILLGLAAAVALQYLLVARLHLLAGAEIRALRRELRERKDVIFLGDSTVPTFADYDSDKRPIDRMLGDLLAPAGLTVGAVAHFAYNPDIYLDICRYIARQKQRPAAVIIPVNLRSFSPAWDLNPMYQFLPERAELAEDLAGALYRPVTVFKYYPGRPSKEDFHAAPVSHGGRVVGRVADFDALHGEAERRRVLLYYYLFPLDRAHRKVSSLRLAAAELRKAGVLPVFYLTPVDHGTGEKYFPGEFRASIGAKAGLVAEVLAAEGAPVLDLSLALGPEAFFWIENPNEHLNEKGRRLVAAELGRRLRAGLGR